MLVPKPELGNERFFHITKVLQIIMYCSGKACFVTTRGEHSRFFVAIHGGQDDTTLSGLTLRQRFIKHGGVTKNQACTLLGNEHFCFCKNPGRFRFAT